MLRLLIIDDEAPARRYLRRLLEAEPGISIAGEAATLDDARQMIKLHRPDAMFLDVDLAHGTAFDLLDGLDITPAVVFVTAHNQYAVRAFDVAAIDYLLKPVSPERLAQALEKLRPRASTYLTTRRHNRTRLIEACDISLAQAQGDYVLLHSAKHGNELIHTTLTKLAQQLPHPPFHTLSRSLIINTDHVLQLTNLPGAQTEVAFHSDVQPVILGRAASLRLKRAML